MNMNPKEYEAHFYLITGAILAPSQISIILSSIASLLAILKMVFPSLFNKKQK